MITPPRSAADSFERIRLDGGATLLFKRRTTHPSVALGAYVRAGSAFETEATSGVNALTHRSMAKGTATRTSAQIAHEAELYGASAAPALGADSSGFSARTITRFFEPAFHLLADVLSTPGFPAEEIERERRLLLAEIAQEEDEPFPLASRAFRRALFGADPYALPVEGNEAGVRAQERDRLVAWYERFYRPENLLFVCVGEIDRERAASRVRDLLDALRAASRAPAAPVAPLAFGRQAAAAEVVIERAVNQDVLLIGFVGPDAADAAYYPLQLLAAIMSGMGNRLFVALRDREGLCYYTGMFYQAFARAGMLGMYIGTSPEKESRARDGLAREIRRLLDDGVAREELDRARRAMIGHAAIGRQTNAAEAGLAARWELLGLGFEEANRFEERLLAVTTDDVNHAAREWIHLDRMTTVTVRPKR